MVSEAKSKRQESASNGKRHVTFADTVRGTISEDEVNESNHNLLHDSSSNEDEVELKTRKFRGKIMPNECHNEKSYFEDPVGNNSSVNNFTANE